MWLDKTYPIDVEVMQKISRLPKVGEDSIEPIFVKDALVEEVYEKYGTHHGKKGVVISIIKKIVLKFASPLLACLTNVSLQTDS